MRKPGSKRARSATTARLIGRVLVCFAIGWTTAKQVVIAQATVTAKLQGRVTARQADGTTQPLPGATVRFQSEDLISERAVVTRRSGHYSSPPLPPGVYGISFSHPGFTPIRKEVLLIAGYQPVVDAESPLERLSTNKSRSHPNVSSRSLDTAQQRRPFSPRNSKSWRC